jgi:FkbM family methyltransferase
MQKLKNDLTRLYTRLFARPGCRRFNLKLFRLALSGLGVLNYQDDWATGEQFLLSQWLPRIIRRRNPVFFDVGANEGHYTSLLLQQFPSASIHAFEPHPATLAKFTARGLPAERVRIHNVALGDSAGVLTLHDHAGTNGSTHASLYQATITEFHADSAVAIQVPIDTLDDVAAREGVDYIDFLKVDTEGHEYAVFAGAARLLRENRIGCIQFEFNALHVYSRVFFRDFRNLLANYELHRLLPGGLLPLDADITSTELFGFQNVLAVPKQLRPQT